MQMEKEVKYIPISTQGILNGYNTVVYPGEFIYSGEWEKGRKVNEGCLQFKSFKIKVKIKQGLIHKSLQILEGDAGYNELVRIFLPNLRIIQDKDNFREEMCTEPKYFFFILGKNFLFDGKPCNFNYILGAKYQNFQLFLRAELESEAKSASLMDLEIKQVHLVGESMNSTPNGLCKIYVNGLKFKGRLKGIFFIGKWIAKTDFFKAQFEMKLKRIIMDLKITSKVLDFQIRLKNYQSVTIVDLKDDSINFEHSLAYKNEINEFISKIIQSFTEIVNSLHSYLSSNLLLSSLFVTNDNWALFENKLADLKKQVGYKDTEYSKESNLDDKYLRIFKNNERYEGKVVNSKFEGFGKYFYRDGSVFIGEFKKNLRDGLGTFKFKDGRIYKGYWEKNMMHGKGCMIEKRKRIYGLWNKNQIIQESICISIKIN